MRFIFSLLQFKAFGSPPPPQLQATQGLQSQYLFCSCHQIQIWSPLKKRKRKKKKKDFGVERFDFNEKIQLKIIEPHALLPVKARYLFFNISTWPNNPTLPRNLQPLLCPLCTLWHSLFVLQSNWMGTFWPLASDPTREWSKKQFLSIGVHVSLCVCSLKTDAFSCWKFRMLELYVWILQLSMQTPGHEMSAGTELGVFHIKFKI